MSICGIYKLYRYIAIILTYSISFFFRNKSFNRYVLNWKEKRDNTVLKRNDRKHISNNGIFKM